ncbi:MAG: 2-(1,2-epoxy,2-dihydrophenyl)acetyl-CoA isomerase [Mycobacterium sp.]|nr:short chain 3-hydroxyacyl-CoA dehydrogenase / enoyl-CoA hydratase [Mycobacterium sp.]MDT5052606.1 2-(1,2-epoxy,2-dihydrophenyl)acetyl-CoA isomerase [Mycobacterium sp.]MDT7739399.1 2-(1,2-epoxy,2-dihydrophenyl)acetyl-CoA isomerase [Mycobacterium sp.]
MVNTAREGPYMTETSPGTTGYGNEQTHLGDLAVSIVDQHVAVVEICRPPNNYFDVDLITDLAEVYGNLDSRREVRAIVLAADGKHFCAGADFGGQSGAGEISADAGARDLYAAAVRLFAVRKPVVAAIQGAAIGGGLGLAMSADFRVASTRARLAANFSRLGFHHGFGLSVTLPRVIGAQRAAELLISGRAVDATEALRIGLVDRLAEPATLRLDAIAFATEIAAAAPLAVESIRATLRQDLLEQVRAATEHERAEQAQLRLTADFAEGVQAAQQRRAPVFHRQ